MEKDPELWVYSESSRDPIYDHIVVTFKSPFLISFLLHQPRKDDFAGSGPVRETNSSYRALTTPLIIDPQYYSGEMVHFGVIEVFSNLTVIDWLHTIMFITPGIPNSSMLMTLR